MHVGTVQGEKPAFVTDWLSHFPHLAQPHHTVASSFLPTEKVDPGPKAIPWFFSFESNHCGLLSGKCTSKHLALSGWLAACILASWNDLWWRGVLG